jgi:hypothetical protein
MSEQRLTVEQEAAQVLEQMVRLKRENLEATEYQRAAAHQYEESASVMRDEIAKINTERDAALAELEERAKGLGLRAEQAIKTEYGTIMFKKGFLRVTYDAKGLDAVAKSPEHGWLVQYRKESSVAPLVKVELAEPA